MPDGGGDDVPLTRAPIGPWFALSFFSLVLAGGFALFLVFARMPILAGLVTDPGFFKRCLVVHVDLALVVWFYAFVAGMFARLPSGPASVAARLSPIVSWIGVGCLLACLGLKDAAPILTNYVPSLDHPLFIAGIGLFFAGVALSFVDARLLPWRETQGSSLIPETARPGLRAAAVAFFFALLTFTASAISVEPELGVEARNELVAWGGGHVLQVASTAAMLTVWLILLEGALGRPVMRRSTASALFFVLVAPTLVAPLLPLMGPERSLTHGAFTRMMQLGIFPVVLVFLVLCLRAIAMHGADRRDRRLLGFYASAGLTVLGFTIGALIRGPNTMIPAHYHASIGAVTAAFMTMSYVVLADRTRRVQPLIFGVGQMVFAVGFGLAGSEGMARKAYGSEQHIRTLTESVGLVTMGLGGLIAVAAGLLFLVYIVRASLLGREATLTRRHTWKSANTFSSR